MGKSRWGAESPLPRKDLTGRVFIPTVSGERQYLETAPPTSAAHSNPGFEDETAGYPDAWDGVWKTGAATITSVTDPVYSGERSMHVHLPAGGTEQVVLSDTFAVEPGGSVAFSFFGTKTLGSPTISLGLLTRLSGTPVFLEHPTSINNEGPAVALSAEWEMFQRTANVPYRHEVARLFARIAAGAAEECDVYLDLSASQVRAPAVRDTGWLELTFGAGWEAWTDTTVELPRCRRTGDSVRLVGNVRRTTGSDPEICTLPQEMWPARALNRGGQVVNGDGGGAVVVGADGVVTLTSPYTNGQFVSLDLEYPVDQE